MPTRIEPAIVFSTSTRSFCVPQVATIVEEQQQRREESLRRVEKANIGLTVLVKKMERGLQVNSMQKVDAIKRYRTPEYTISTNKKHDKFHVFEGIERSQESRGGQGV